MNHVHIQGEKDFLKRKKICKKKKKIQMKVKAKGTGHFCQCESCRNHSSNIVLLFSKEDNSSKSVSCLA